MGPLGALSEVHGAHPVMLRMAVTHSATALALQPYPVLVYPTTAPPIPASRPPQVPPPPGCHLAC